ncbi:MAG: histidine kinase [Solirubrobacterales bacterium]|nr:histidine kinase [Solirubrobacterales bacterium]
MSPPPLTLDELRTIDLFDDLDEAELRQWLGVAILRYAEPGEVIAEQGMDLHGVTLLLEGTAQTLMRHEDRTEPVGEQHAPTWMGAIGVLTEAPLVVQMVAVSTCRLALLPALDFRRLVLAQPVVHGRIMRQIGPVMNRVARNEANHDRLTALGTMAAGLAHELNNPAAAAKRASAQMADALDVLSASLGGFVDAGVERDDAAALVALQREALTQMCSLTALGALDAADAEDAFADRLDELGVADGWALAEPLAAAGLDQPWLERVVRHAGPAAEVALRWVAASLTARGLASELLESTARMSSLVGAVKAYAYMDRGSVVEADVHEGLETTLVVLGHKLKQTTITVARDYDRTLPPLMMRGSELNQVRKNLQDNAIDALGQTGTITITTRRDGACVLVDIADDGPGIPPDVVGRIFDQFFTTKEVGRGTGLGLATARQIVVEGHRGSLTVDSSPAGTVFHVWLPVGAG